MGFAAVNAAAIEPGQLLEVLANIDLATKRWRRKAQLIGILGRWGEGHRVGMRELNRRTGISFSLLEQLLAELVEARVLVVVELGTGTRATTWTVSASVDRWRGVPWLRPVDAIERWVFHVEHEQYATTGQRSAYRPRSERKPKQRSEGANNAERKPKQRSEGGPYAERNENAAFRSGGVGRALADTSPEKGCITPSSDLQRSSSSSAVPTTTAGIDPASGEWRALRNLVIRAGGGKFLAGVAEWKLQALAEQWGIETVRGWVTEAPARLGVPALVEWLADRPHDPTADELAAIDQAAALGEPEPEDDPARPLLRPVAEVLSNDAPTPDPIAALRAARSHLDPLGSERIVTSEVTP